MGRGLLSRFVERGTSSVADSADATDSELPEVDVEDESLGSEFRESLIT